MANCREGEREMKPIEAAGIGILMGLLYGVTLWASLDAFSTASFITHYHNSINYPDRIRVSVLL
jgi:hypothetical protein